MAQTIEIDNQIMETDQTKSSVDDLQQEQQAINLLGLKLPYADHLDEEATRLFSLIKTNLAKSVLAHEIYPGCTLWITRLKQYIKIYGFKFPKDDHIALVKMFYEILIIPDLELTRVHACCNILMTLLNKKRLLSRDDLQLEWRPLYDLSLRTVKKRKYFTYMMRSLETYATTLYNTIRECRFYFPASATKEILDELRSILNPWHLISMNNYITYLEIFLPIAVKPEEVEISHKLWLDDIINTPFECRYQEAAWENNILKLLSGVARFQMGYIDWEPYVAPIYARIQRFLGLPVHLNSTKVKKQYNVQARFIGQWIIYTLHNKNSTFFHFEKLMQMITSYYYTANFGPWSPGLLQLLIQLTHLFVQRVYFERYKNPSWDINFPESHKLSDDDIDRFVDIIHICLEPAVFSGIRIERITKALSDLASLRPTKILPLILEKLYPSLDSLTEPNKLISCLSAAIATGRFLVNGLHNNYPEGPTHVVHLLRALLPGIDKNDGRKSLATFHFISNIIMMVPVIDSSKAYEHYTDLNETEHMICESTAGFEDFILEFFDRLFVYIESSTLDIVRLEQLANTRDKLNVDVLTIKIIGNVATTILNQLSPSIYMKALKKFYNFALERTFEIQVAGKMVATLANSFCAVNPSEVLKLFLPKLCDILQDSFKENPKIMQEEQVDSKFLYNLLLLAKVVNGRDHILPYMGRLTIILDKTLHMTCVEASHLAGLMLEGLIASLSDIQSLDFRSSDVSYDTHIQDFLSIREWGKSQSIKEVNINWYVPKEREINMVQNLMNKYLIPELDQLNQYSNGQIEITRQQLKCSLKIVIAMLAGHLLMPPLNEPVHHTEFESVLDECPFGFMVIDNGSEVTMPDGSNIRKAIVDTMHRVQCKLLQIDEDDTKSFLYILHIYDMLTTNNTDTVFGWLKLLYTSKTIPQDRLHRKKQCIRHIAIERVLSHQKARITHRSLTFTKTHKQIINDLFDLSLSRYRETRLAAQRQLFNLLNFFPYSYKILTSKIKETLLLNPNENQEQFKGCLTILFGSKESPIIVRNDWKFLKEIWPLVIQSQPSEEQSIINIISNITERVNKHFPTFAIDLAMTDGVVKAAYDLANTEQFKCDLTNWQRHIDNGKEYLKQLSLKRKEDYTELIDSILEICHSGKLHWRYQKMGSVFLKCLVHNDVHYNANVVKFLLESIIDDSSTIRNATLQAAVFAMNQNKPKFKKIEIDPYLLSTNTIDTDQSRENGNTPLLILSAPAKRNDEWVFYNSKTLCDTSQKWNSATFVHNQIIGYNVWPKPTLIYPTNQKSILSRLDKITDTEREIFNFFKKDNNIKKLIEYYSMEENGKLNQFFANRFAILKNMFKMFEDEFLSIFITHVEKLIEGRPCQHRYASEIVSAIISGSKHWPFTKIEKMWQSVIPIINNAINKMTCESFNDWALCICHAMNSRDPRTCHWLLEYLTNNPLADSTTFTTCNRLRLLCAAINQSWRNSELFQRLLQYLLPHLAHPFQNVREYISFSMSYVFAYDTLCIDDENKNHPYPKIADFYNLVIPELNVLSMHLLTILISNEPSESDQDELEYLFGNSNKTLKEMLRMFITVTQFTCYTMLQVKFTTRTEYFQLLPLAAMLQNYDKNDEAKESSKELLFILGEALTTEKYMPDAIEAIKLTATCPLWSARAMICQFISVFVFHNMPIINCNKNWVLEIQNIAIQLLEDSHPEVGEAAVKLTSGLLHTNFISDQKELLDTFKQKAKTALKKNRNANKEKKNLLTRYSGVMGLCSFIKAHPYDVPDYLPDLFSSLRNNLSDPQPISATIRKTMGEFKRTHQDNWEEHKLKFTPDELSVLSDLSITPSYFV